MTQQLKLGVLFVSLLLFLQSGNYETDVLYWSQNHKLDWNDFQGNPRYDYHAISALTSSGIVDYKGCKDGKIIYKIRAYFEKNNSWVKQEAYTDYHLAHEQLHFDITELYARKLKKLLKHQSFECGQEVAFETFVNNVLENWYNEQKTYDTMTRHSIDRNKQKEWFYRVQMELSLLEDFKE